MDDKVKYFQVSVRLQEETDATDRAGNPKIKKWNELWVVRADTSEQANKIVTDEYNGSLAEWRIAQVKETKIIGILNDNPNL